MRFGLHQTLMVCAGAALILLPALGLITEVFATTHRFSGLRDNPMFFGYGLAFVLAAPAWVIDRGSFLRNGTSMLLRRESGPWRTRNSRPPSTAGFCMPAQRVVTAMQPDD